MIRRISLVGGLGAVVLLLLAACWALYQSPRLPYTFAWDGQAWVASSGERLHRLNGQELTPYTLMVDNFALQSRAEMFRWFAEKDKLFQALEADQVELQMGSRVLRVPVHRQSWDFLKNPALLHLPVGIAFFVVGWATYLRPGAGREIQLTDAIGRLLREEAVLAYEFQGKRYDCGSKIGYLQATVNYALKHPELASDFRAFLATLSTQGRKT